MIEIIGEKGTSEYSAAVSVAKAIGKLWKGIETSPSSQEHICIAASVKISGYRISDIDIVVCGVFRRDRKFIPRKLIKDMNGNSVVKKPVIVENFVLAIEVKDHDESGVQFNGDNVSVKYSRGAKKGWKSATDQNINQVHSLNHYLKDLGHDSYVHRCVIMRGLGSISINGALSSNFDGVDFFTALVSVSRVRKSTRGYSLSSGPTSEISRILNAPIFKLITPTALDRKRMDMIVVSTPESERLFDSLGKKMIHLRGHGGTGKTIMCLQMAWKAFDEQGLRTLVLTYNHALAADIRRLLALLHIPSNPEEGGIVVETVMSFMYSWFFKLQVIEREEELSYKTYETHCNETIKLLEADAITTDDVMEIIRTNPDRYDFDCVVVDESQDWPQGEVELLKMLYRPSNICIADGIDQLIRGHRSDWFSDVSKDDQELITLTRCLRMKRNLTVFVNKLADVNEIKWNVTPNDMAGGGKIIILLKPYHECHGLHERLLESAKSKGNEELDFLFCVPPSSVTTQGQHKVSDIGEGLSNSGYEVWDGVDEVARKDFPRSKKQYRIVQYASCRGLEGWTVVSHNFNQYWEECKSNRKNEGLTKGEELAFEDIDDVSRQDAWHRVLIALTRPIDTLVIGLDDDKSEFSSKLLEVAKMYSDFVEVID